MLGRVGAQLIQWRGGAARAASAAAGGSGAPAAAAGAAAAVAGAAAAAPAAPGASAAGGAGCAAATRRNTPPSWVTKKDYDVFIVGGGVTGTALLYSLVKFTNVNSIALAERRRDFALVASGPNNNSQTIHCGDIETNYNYEKAKTVRRQADMLRNYATKLPSETRDKCVHRMQKMVLGVGEDECAAVEKRYEEFRSLFPRMELMHRSKLREFEPNVVRISNYRDRRELVSAITIADEHSAVNYYELTASFVKEAATAAAASGAKVDVSTNTEVKNITLKDDDTYVVHTPEGNFGAKFVVLAGCGYSLLFAQKMGYGLNYSCFPVSGSFYFAKKPLLRGKVYTIQDPKLPFAAVHGDPDVHTADNLTRFGPTALPLPLLERGNSKSFFDFCKVAKPDMASLGVLFNLFRDPVMIRYAMRNILFEVPGVGESQFLQDARKIAPGLEKGDLVYAHGFGGIRPQLIDKKAFKLTLGEGKITGNNIIFNITPSPGGTTCLGNAEKDMRHICAQLGAKIDEAKFKSTLYQGEYPIDYL